jgi:hypothetical protein
VRIDLDLYGPLKRFGPRVTIEVQEPASAASVKRALAAALRHVDARLIEVSALGDDERIYAEDETIQAGVYALLPPVAGG